jgi:hypothetical protein
MYDKGKQLLTIIGLLYKIWAVPAREIIYIPVHSHIHYRLALGIPFLTSEF